MLLTVVAIIAVLLLGFLVFVSTRPATFRYTRRLAIAAPTSELFEQVNDLRKFQEWNPWAKVDPQCQIIYSGSATGVGSSYEWKGNKHVGEGAMTITESKPHQLVRARMDFRKPFAATHTAEFTFRPEGDRTVVSWSMYGDNNFMGKIMMTVMDCDKMVGGEFEKGLATLKARAETPVMKA
jgi:hypothetical protein